MPAGSRAYSQKKMPQKSVHISYMWYHSNVEPLTSKNLEKKSQDDLIKTVSGQHQNKAFQVKQTRQLEKE